MESVRASVEPLNTALGIGPTIFLQSSYVGLPLINQALVDPSNPRILFVTVRRLMQVIRSIPAADIIKAIAENKQNNPPLSPVPAPAPAPGPAQGKAKLSLSVTNQATQFFRITNVSWSIERQELNGAFTFVASPSGTSAIVEPPALGQYHIHAEVSVEDLLIGGNFIADFRGNSTVNGVHTLLVVWTGNSLTENFRLTAEPPSGAQINAVVSL